MDVTISLTGSACGGLAAASHRDRGAGVAVVAVAASGDGSPARPYPLTAPFRELRVLALLAAAGSAGVFAVVMRGPAGTAAGPASGRAVRFVMGGLGGCHRDW